MKSQRKYSFINNYIYTLKITAKCNKFMLFIVLLMGMIEFIEQILGVYIPKIVLGLIEKRATINKFAIILIVIAISLCIVVIIENYLWQLFDIFDVKIYAFLEKKRMNKVYDTDYKNMESPEFLNYIQKAKNATYQGRGFRGILKGSKNFLAQGSMAIVSAILIGSKNSGIMIIICIFSMIVGKILSTVTKIDKEKFIDYMAQTNRKISYLDRVARNFDFAKDIRIYNMSHVFKQQFDEVNDVFINKNYEHHNRWIICNFSMEVIILIQKTIMYSWLVYLVITNQMLISDFVLYIGLITSFNDAIGYISWTYSDIKLNTFMVNDYRNFITWQEECKKTDGENFLIQHNENEYEFRFENVSFKYPGHNDYVLKNINYTIKNGMKLAIVGSNGAGKTTFVKLIMRMYDPTEGRILLNGVDIKKYNREDYFKIFSPVFQNVECFALPLYQNISFKDENNTDVKKIENVLRKSDLWSKISKYKKGIKTNLLKIFDEKGINISGGEQQRLAMARALYKDGKVVVLDEPTAALDALAEDRMYRKFKSIVGNKTSIFISHRLGSTQFCDHIIMIEDGKIIEEGRHEDLMKLNKKYAHMFKIQSRYYGGDDISV